MNQKSAVQKQWYAVRTASRAEKKVKERLEKLGIDHYLPIQTIIRLWSDRKKKVELPVIGGYIFAKSTPDELHQLHFIQGVFSVLKENGAPAPIPEEQINNLKRMAENTSENLEFSSENLEKGRFVRIKSGQLKGITGRLIEIKGLYKVAVQLDHLGHALITISKNSLEILPEQL